MSLEYELRNYTPSVIIVGLDFFDGYIGNMFGRFVFGICYLVCGY